MPALPSPGNVVKIQFTWTVGADLNAQTGYHFRYSGGAVAGGDVVGIASQAFSYMQAQATAWGPTTSLTSCRVIDLSSQTGAEATHNGSVAGTSAGTGVLGANTCVLVNYAITKRYRGGKPRSYLPWGMSSELASRQQWSSTALTKFQSNAAAFIADLTGYTSGATTLTAPCVVSYYENFKVETDPGTGRARNVPQLKPVPDVYNITSTSVSAIPASQRRRLQN